MENIQELTKIAKSLQLSDVASSLLQIEARSQEVNKRIILPLVGEFSSGKTTLINALTDGKMLETATKPTTATIYEVHFGSDKCNVHKVKSNGEVEQIENIDSLTNDSLSDDVLIRVFDTSTSVPSTTILVDTPGLSSSDQKHKQTLIDYLPYSDGILLVTDINQQITRSLSDFIRTADISKRPIYLIITKCDTKSKKELEHVKKYISENNKLPIEHLACVSANVGNMQELYDLFAKIQKDKNAIIKQVDEQRISNLAKFMVQYIDKLLRDTNSDNELDKAICHQEHELDLLKRNIDHLIDESQAGIEVVERQITRQFEDCIFDRLDELVAGKSANFDAEAVSTINSTTTLLLNNYKVDLQEVFRNKVRESRNTENPVSLRSLEEQDLSSLSIDSLSYNLDLNSLGHQYDSMISKGLVVVAAAGVAVAGVAALGALGTAGTAGAAGTAGTAVSASKMIDAVDTASDVVSIASNSKTATRIEKASSFLHRTNENMAKVDELNQVAGQQFGSKKGIVSSIVGFVTDEMMGKPQRKRAISNYLDSQLVPDFRRAMKQITQQLVKSISDSIQEEAAATIEQKTHLLEVLMAESKSNKDVYRERISQLKSNRSFLVTI